MTLDVDDLLAQGIKNSPRPQERKLPNWLQSFTEYAAFSEAPMQMLFWVGVSAVAGALRRRVYIDQKYFKWIPNFYIILVAPPGIVSKSTTASIGMNLLRRVPGIHFGPDVVTWQALAQALAGSQEMIDRGGGVYEAMCALTIESSEFGTFLNPNDREMVDMLVSLWDGKEGVFKKLTKTQGEDVIENPFINFVACTTPAWIEGNFPEYMIGGGFTSRAIFIYAEEKRQYVAYPSLVVPPNFKEMQDALVHDLEQIALLHGEYTLSPDAVNFGAEWYIRHYSNRPPHLDNERFGGYIARKQTHLHKLAMVLAASKGDSLILTPDILAEADRLITSLESDMPRVFERIGTQDSARGGAMIVEVMRAHKAMPKGTLYRELFRKLSYDDFEIALSSAFQAQKIKIEQRGSEVWVTYVEAT